MVKSTNKIADQSRTNLIISYQIFSLKMAAVNKIDEEDENNFNKSSMNLSKIFPRPTSTPSRKDNGNKKDERGLPKRIGSGDSGVEFTPVESFGSEPEVILEYIYIISLSLSLSL